MGFCSAVARKKTKEKEAIVHASAVGMRWLLAGALLFVTAGARPSFHVNVYPEGVAFELRVFVSASPRTFTAFNDTHALIWHAKDFEYTADFSLRAHTAHVPPDGRAACQWHALRAHLCYQGWKITGSEARVF